MVDTPPKVTGLSTLFYLEGVLFSIVKVPSIQVRKSCYRPSWNRQDACSHSFMTATAA